MTALVGFLVTIWMLGMVGAVLVSVTHGVRPTGWPWSVPLWPIFIAAEVWDHYQKKRRLRRLLREAFRR